jgi:apolipoprotein N-acyltransferase
MIMDGIGHLSPRKQAILSILLGMLTSLAYAPMNVIFAPFISIPLWLYLLEINQKQSWTRHFSLGFWFGLGYFLCGIYWMSLPLGADFSRLWVFIPVTLLGLQGFMALHLGLMAVLLKFTNSTGLSRCLWFAALWTTAEIAVSKGPFGMPWNIFSSMWSGFEPILQLLPYMGTYGLTLLTALFVSFPILFIHKLQRRDITYLASLAVIFSLSTAWGFLRPNHTPLLEAHHPPLLRIVQPNIPQVLHWQQDKVKEQFTELLALSNQPSLVKPDLIIWPESSLPIMLQGDRQARQSIAHIMPPQSHLITGSVRLVVTPEKEVDLYNSVMVLNDQGAIEKTYDKFHLVPVGEYLPLRSIIPYSITKVASGNMDYTPGHGPETMSIGSLPPFSPLICFEALFSGEIIAPGSPRPLWILNITNDAWFGNTSEPYQHVQLNRMRGIEEGLALVRVANTGISVVFDAFGREVHKLDLMEKGIMDVPLPPALLQRTPFGEYGHLILAVMMVMTIASALILRRIK